MGLYNPFKRELVTSNYSTFLLEQFYKRVRSTDIEDIYQKNDQYAIVVKDNEVRTKNI